MEVFLICILFVIEAAYSANTPGGKQNFPMLRGVNRSGTEYSCMKGTGIFDNPADDSTIAAMKEWKINTVRIPLNEGCWFERHVPKGEYAGKYYQADIEAWIRRLRENDMYVILELHWTEGKYKGPAQSKDLSGTGLCFHDGAICQKPMPDLTIAPKFWGEIANMFKNDEKIIFDVFNEPYPDRLMTDKKEAWKCWRNGKDDCKGFDYRIAGMQDLVNAIRETGAKNLIMLGGLDFSNDLDGWMENLPDDPEDNLAASMHSYNFNSCTTKECWDKGIGKIYEKYPVIVGEIGENDCGHKYIDELMPYLEERKISYLGWTWNNWNCKDGPSLIEDETGKPTPFGIGFKEYLAKVVS